MAGDVLIGALRDDDSIAVVDELHFDKMVGAVALTEGEDLLVAAFDRLVRVTTDERRVEGPPLFAGADRRFNDGKPDPGGRYVVGTMSMSGPSATEQLFRVHGSRVETVDDDLTLSNGLAWTADGTRMYSVDTVARVIRVRDHDVASGASGE